jgi:hypothetical protein
MLIERNADAKRSVIQQTTLGTDPELRRRVTDSELQQAGF